MSLDAEELRRDLDKLEEIEKASVRLVTQALYDFRHEAKDFFFHETDKPGDIGEDITREAMDNIGVSKIPVRLFGKIDYKRARYVFHPEYHIKQALFVDSKAEKDERTATLQTSQVPMRIRQIRGGQEIDVEGELPPTIEKDGENYLTTAIFVKYNYNEPSPSRYQLVPWTRFLWTGNCVKGWCSI